METTLELLNQSGFANLSIGNWIMFIIAGVLIFLAITKEYEPSACLAIHFKASVKSLAPDLDIRWANNSVSIEVDSIAPERFILRCNCLAFFRLPL